MSELRDPPRWLESGFLPEDVATQLAAYAGEAPLPARKARMFEQLSAQLGEAPGPDLVRTPPPVSLLKLKLLLGSAALLAGVVALWQATAAPLPAATAPLAIAEARARAEFRTAPLAPALAAEQPAPAPTRAPSASRKRTVAAPVPQPPPVTAPMGAPDALAELTMLARARKALLNDPARSLALCEEHAQAHPRGAFGEEREVLAIESLLKLERTADARARALEFERHFPRSAHLAHLAKLIAKPSE